MPVEGLNAKCKMQKGVLIFHFAFLIRMEHTRAIKKSMSKIISSEKDYQ